jgi:cytochrome c-type biogenesis protein CcsB
MKMVYKIMPWFFLALFASEVIGILLPKPDGVFHVREFAQLPVLLNGRVQPFDSVARNSLLQIRSTADLPLEIVPAWEFWHHPKKLRSTAWLLELMTQPAQADERPIFLIHHPDLLSELNLTDKGIDHSGLRYYTFNQIEPVVSEILEQGRNAQLVDEQLRTPLERQVIKLDNAVLLYQNLKYTLHPKGIDDFADEIGGIQEAIAPGVQAFIAKDAKKPFDQAAYDRLFQIATDFDNLKADPGAGQSYPLVVPPSQPQVARDDWGNLGAGVMESIQAREIFPPLQWLATAESAYHDGNPAAFNGAVADYTQWLAKNLPKELAKGRHEYFYNSLSVFLHAIIIYMFAFLLTAASLLTLGTFSQLSEALRRSAFYLIILAGLVHTFGLIFRMVLEGRPPVTNLYSSAIFIGWGAMVLGLILERIYRLGIGNAVASLAGFITLLIAQNLAVGGDTMEMMRAVLDNNYWLATHVVVVTLGYASTFAAGLLAIVYVVLGVFTPILSHKLTPEEAAAAGASNPASKSARTAKKSAPPANQPEVGKALAKMVYGIVCFATLFSFVGTVLGGIWADQSWGRFWGWDPKENGALLIVIWNAAILHARWGGLVRERGLMNMAIFGNIVTSFSWFGVNMLGIGLHSYGFMAAAFNWLIAFIVSQIVLILLGLLPRRFWRSFRPPTSMPPTAPSGGSARPVPATG